MIKSKVFQSNKTWRRLIFVIPVISFAVSLVVIIRAVSVNPYNVVVAALFIPLYWIMFNFGGRIFSAINNASEVGIPFINATIFSMTFTYMLSFIIMNVGAIMLSPVLSVVVNIGSIIVSGLFFFLVKKTDFNIIVPGAIQTTSGDVGHGHNNETKINPANGVPMVSGSSIDVQGNTYGTTGRQPH